MKKYCFDIDGTICNNTWGDYDKAIPFIDRINKINQLYNDGHYIVYFTARGMGKCSGNIACVYNMWYNITYKQLNKWECKYHELILGKPHADYFIDDKGISDHEFFRN